MIKGVKGIFGVNVFVVFFLIIFFMIVVVDFFIVSELWNVV